MTIFTRRTVLQGTLALGAAGLLAGCSSEQTSNSELALPDGLQEKTIGDADAPVKVIEYASMTCPHCASFHNRTYPAVKEKYIDTGQVHYAFREFPLDPVGATVAVLARCAPEDRFFDVIDVFFKSQATWRVGTDPLPGIVNIAKQLGFTEKSVNACLTNQEVIAGVNKIRSHGAETLKVDATPTFFINGKKISGAISFEQFEEEVRPHLEG